MVATCALSAAPLPHTACFTSFGVGSSIGTPASAAASSATPRAWPTAIAVCTLRWKKRRSIPTRSGRCSAISCAKRRVKLAEAFGVLASAGVRMQPASTIRTAPSRSSTTPKPQTAVPGSMPSVITPAW